jgi:acyl carrier protein
MSHQEFESNVFEFVRSHVAFLCGRSADSIRGDTDFFELGLDSLRVILLARAIQEKFGHDVSLREFYSACSVGSMTKLICERHGRSR